MELNKLLSITLADKKLGEGVGTKLWDPVSGGRPSIWIEIDLVKFVIYKKSNRFTQYYGTKNMVLKIFFWNCYFRCGSNHMFCDLVGPFF